MLDDAFLRDRFEQLLTQQRRAEGFYASMLDRTPDPARREQLEQIHREKRRHILLTERMLEILG